MLAGLLLLAGSVPAAAANPLPPLPPQGFQGTYNATLDTVTLTWQPPDDAHTYRYALYRDTTPLGIVEGLAYTDTSPGDTRLYLIQAVRDSTDAERASVQTAGTPASRVELYSAPAVAWVIVECAPVVIIIGGPSIVSPGIHEECL